MSFVFGVTDAMTDESSTSASSTAATDYGRLAGEALERCVLFLVMSRHDNQQNDMMHRLKLLHLIAGRVPSESGMCLTAS